MNRILFFIIVLITAFASSVKATHNRAGEITYHCDSINPYHYYFTITTYTKADSQADRCTLTVHFCDMNDSSVFYRVNGPSGTACEQPAKLGELIGNNVRKNIYKGEHTFNGNVLSCRIMMEDPNRNADIQNIPNSVNTPFFLVTTLSINPLIGSNNSPILLNPPIQNACYCKRFIHNPSAYDPDGDSLSYKLITPFTSLGVEVNCYTLPSGVTLNPITGDLVWQCPGAATSTSCGTMQQQGEFNFAFVIEEWRSGQLIGTVERDMQVTVVAGCDNNPPVVEARDTCIIAGEILNMMINAHDVPFIHGTDTTLDNVTLSATGGPFVLSNSPAEFITVGGSPDVSSLFSWQTECSHVKKALYHVTFLAEDNNAINKLSDAKTINIEVVGPPPVIISAVPIGNSIKLDWQNYTCTNAIGYKIFRKIGCPNIDFEYCQTGIPESSGYTFLKNISDLSTLTFLDNNNGIGLSYGQEYSYRLIAYFSDSALSKASNEKCAMLRRDVPIITNISIYNTDLNNGKDTLRWVRPTDFDSIVQYPPPYYYLLYRTKFPSTDFTFVDTVKGITNNLYLLDTHLNTTDTQYVYRIDFYAGNNHLVGSSNTATSIRLEAVPSDNAITLNIKYTVPWTIDSFYIYRELPTGSGNYILAGITTQNSFTNNSLLNGRTYFFKVLTIGHYSDTTIFKPLYNMSQVISAIPIDTTAPCPPVLNVTPDCSKGVNNLRWTNPNTYCADDVVKYKLYFTPIENGEMIFKIEIAEATNTELTHIPDSLSIAGCYTVTAVDSFNNESNFSDTVCVDNCPFYYLPNVFSPNNDGANDNYISFPYKYVKDINMFIYDRWGVLVYETTNPKIGWDGTNFKTKQECDDGVFYYVCTVNEIRLKGITPRTIKGFIQKISTATPGKQN